MEEDHAFNNWDLQAVVRSCRSTQPPPPVTVPVSSEPVFIPPPPTAMAHAALKEEVSRDYNNPNWCFPDLMAAPSGLQELEELCKSFYPKSPLGGGGSTVSETLVVGPAINQPGLLPPPPFLVQKIKPSRPQIPRSKRRKNQPKKLVRTVPADGGSSDMWAWRKYGQKPIKGSPYPRGYYRCSSSKGCLARKQVERSRTDPSTLIITYTAEHNHPVPTHRNSLAGSTRQKCLPVASTTTTTTTSSSSTTGSGGEGNSPLTGLSPNTPLMASLDEDEEEEEEEEGMLLVEDLEVMREDEFLILGKGGEGTRDVQLKRIGEDFSDLLDDLCFNPPWSVNSGNDSAALAGDSAS